MDQMIVVPTNRKQNYSQSASAYIDFFDKVGWLVAPSQIYRSFSRSSQVEPSPLRVGPKNEGISETSWEGEFAKISRLQGGWNGYTAPAPSKLAIDLARSFVDSLLREKYEPRRLAPSVVGGIGVTHRKDDKTAYVEFYNDGRILALFSDDVNDPEIKRIEPSYQSFKKLIKEMRDYLDA